MRQAGIGGERGEDDGAVDAEDAGRGDGGGGILRIVRSGECRPVGLRADVLAPQVQPPADDADALVGHADRRDLDDARDRDVADVARAFVVLADDRGVGGNLHLEQPRLGRGIGGHRPVAVEVVGGDVGQHRDLATRG